MPASSQIAVRLLQADRLPEAEELCRQELRALPDDLQFLTILGLVLHRTGRLEEAIAVTRRAADAHPGAQEPLGTLAVLLQSAGQPGPAVRCLSRLQALHPGSVLAAQKLGIAAQTAGDLDGGLRHVRRAARLDPTAGGTLFNLGAIHTLVGDPEAAERSFACLVMVEPEGSVGYGQQAALLLALGQVDRAAVLFDRARRLDPASAEARDGQVRCLRYRVAAAASRHSGVPEGVLIRGPYQGISGYAHMTNRLADAMEGLGTRVHKLGLVGSEPWASRPETMVRSRSILNCQTPPTIEPVPGLLTVNLSMFEGTRIPQPWLRFSERHDLVIVPTVSSRLAWAGRGFPEDRLRVCPLGVDPEPAEGPAVHLLTPAGRPALSFRHRILNVSDFIPRKNLDGVLRVWLKATSAADDAVLILKLGKGNPQTAAAVQMLFHQTEAVVGRRFREAAPIILVLGALDEASMDGLFRTSTHYWSLSHGEGWDLPMSRAGAMGLQLVAPAHSSYVDYLDDTVARLIPSAPGPAHLPNSREPWPTFYGLDWWEPDEDTAAQTIGRIVRGEDTRRLDARSRLLDRFTWPQAAQRLLHILRDAGAL